MTFFIYATMKKQFFKPFVGKYYTRGIKGKKILVIGASFYCNRVKCPYFAECTNVDVKDSAPYDNICPEYVDEGKKLHFEPRYCVEDYAPQTYQRFASYIGRFLGITDYDTIWQHMAFTNYVQFMLPADENSYRGTYLSDLSERDYEAFNEVLLELQPDIVVVWGSIINSRLKECNQYIVDIKELQETNYYVCHLDIPGLNHPIVLINPYHPSSSAWYIAMDEFNNYFFNLINN